MKTFQFFNFVRNYSQSISPGIVKTPILKNCLGDEIDRLCYETNPYLQTEDIASAVEYILGTPAHVQVNM